MNALGDTLNKTYNLANLGQNVFGNIDVMKLVGEEFFKELFTPHSGMHILLGAMVKIPILPLGIYADGKFMIPFDKPDANVELGGAGLFVDGGVALTF